MATLAMRRIVLAHGGTASTPDMADGPQRAAEAGLDALEKEGALAAVVAAVAALEDDERFNAGTGADLRFDGKTVEMDAAVMDSRKQYGAVTAVRDVKNPVRLAHALVGKPVNVLSGEGASRLDRALGHPAYDPRTKRARKKWEDLIEAIRRGEASQADNEWDYATLKRAWNYPTPFEAVFGPEPWPPRKADAKRHANEDTVGAVATDGKTFAAATSTGGMTTTLMGRVGDSPIAGAGLFAGEFGAVVLSGNGDHILRERAATKLHGWLGDGFSAQAAVRRLTSRYSESTDVWAGIVGLEDHAGGGNRDIAWAVAQG